MSHNIGYVPKGVRGSRDGSLAMFDRLPKRVKRALWESEMDIATGAELRSYVKRNGVGATCAAIRRASNRHYEQTYIDLFGVAP